MVLGEGAGQHNHDEGQECRAKEGGDGEGWLGHERGTPILRGSFATFLTLRFKCASRQPQGVQQGGKRDILKDRSMDPNPWPGLIQLNVNGLKQA
jgi:hypothetical protein